jgi:hypothetical protein
MREVAAFRVEFLMRCYRVSLNCAVRGGAVLGQCPDEGTEERVSGHFFALSGLGLFVIL